MSHRYEYPILTLERYFAHFEVVDYSPRTLLTLSVQARYSLTNVEEFRTRFDVLAVRLLSRRLIPI